MNEKWINWIPMEGMPTKLELNSIVSDDEALKINLYDLEKKIDVTVRFQSVFSFRNTDEGNRLKLLNYLNDKDFFHDGSMYLVENSEYVSWIHEESLGIYETVDLKHFVFITPNEILEIVSGRDPEIILIPR